MALTALLRGLRLQRKYNLLAAWKDRLFIMILEPHWKELASKGVKILNEYNIVYLALEMRVGKTPTSLMVAKGFVARDILFVTPKKAITGIEDFNTAMGNTMKVKIINYEQLHHYDGNPDLIIIDEAHKCGAFPKPSCRAEQLKFICQDKPIIYLSGTPSPESFSQLFHQFWISSYSPWKEYEGPTAFYKWAHDYVTIKKKMYNGHQMNDYTRADQTRIETETKHLFVSYTQAEAGFKQIIEEEVLSVRMKDPTYNLAKKLINNRIYTGKNGHVVLADTSVKLQNKLHQVYSGTVITEDGDVSAIIFDYSKVSMIAEVFAGKKIAIFYKFRAEEIMIRGHLGRPTTTDPKQFNNSNDVVFISQIQSGSEGVDLKTADAILFLNIDFSAKSYIQARQRLQFKDRSTPAKVYWVFAESGIEHKIYEVVKNKMDFTNAYFKKVYGIRDPNKNKEPPGSARMVNGKNNNLQQTRVA